MVSNSSKIIGVGFHKTGLSSLHLALKILGFSSIKGIQAFKNSMDVSDVVELLKKRKHDELFKYLDKYDSVVDNPWNILFKELDQAYPSSKFILTERDEYSWIRSAYNYFKNRPDHLIREWVYGEMNVQNNEELFVRRYKRHNAEVLDYFQDKKEDLLIVNWEKGDGWNELCPFLNKPIIELPFPHANQNMISK